MAPSATSDRYVRLTDRMARSMWMDMSTGWSIAGLDVLPYPGDDTPAEKQAVRDLVNRGILEECDKADWEAVMEQDHDYLAAAGITIKPVELEGHYSEADVVNAAEAHRKELEARRGLVPSGLSYKADTVRRKALLKQQYALEKGKSVDDVTDDEVFGESPNAAVERGESGQTSDGGEQQVPSGTGDTGVQTPGGDDAKGKGGKKKS